MGKESKIPETPIEQLMSILQTDPLSACSVGIVLLGFFLYQPAVALSTFSGVAVMGVCFQLYEYMTRSSNNDDDKGTGKATRSTTSSMLNSKNLKNVWELGKSSAWKSNSSNKNKNSSDRPFGSKYYYAHNNPGATGGYKDGLRMEDYTMNGPRLLSRGGVDIEILPDDGDDSNDDDKTKTTTTKNNTEGNEEEEDAIKDSISEKSNETPVRNITKYLWDDPGDWNGIATIRIDSLPAPTIAGNSHNTNLIDWKDVTVSTVEAKLVGEGLDVQISTTNHGKYQLKLKKLYGDAADVRTIVKTKRLLVRIHKKKNAVLSTTKKSKNKDDSNLDAWPQPYRRI